MKYSLYIGNMNGKSPAGTSNNKSVLIHAARLLDKYNNSPATVCRNNGDIIYENKAQRKINQEG